MCKGGICRKRPLLPGGADGLLEFHSSLWKVMAAGSCRKMKGSVSGPSSGAIHLLRLLVGC